MTCPSCGVEVRVVCVNAFSLNSGELVAEAMVKDDEGLATIKATFKKRLARWVTYCGEDCKLAQDAVKRLSL